MASSDWGGEAMAVHEGRRSAEEEEEEAQPSIECLLFDLDDTLYPLSTGIAAACAQHIRDYMVEKLGFRSADADTVKKDLYHKYGTSMAGLVACGYSFDYHEFHDIVHSRLPYERLQPDLPLRSLLLRLPQRKLIFTNADYSHAIKALTRLNLLDCFERIICFETFNSPDSRHIVCKPSLHCFKHAIRVSGVHPSRTLFLDDSPRNIRGAKSAGLRTVLVGSTDRLDGAADYAIESIHNMADAIPHILLSSSCPFMHESTESSLPEAIAVRA